MRRAYAPLKRRAETGTDGDAIAAPPPVHNFHVDALCTDLTHCLHCVRVGIEDGLLLFAKASSEQERIHF